MHPKNLTKQTLLNEMYIQFNDHSDVGETEINLNQILNTC